MDPVDVGVKAGDILAGKYRVDRVLGAGRHGGRRRRAPPPARRDGRAQVPAAGTRWAIPRRVARFGREARAAVKIKSEHVARVTDVGQLENGVALHGHGVPRGRGPRATARTARAARRSSRRSTSCSRPARPSPRRTRSGSSTAISSRRTSSASSARTAASRSRCSTSASRRSTTPGAEGHAMTRTNAFMGSPLYMSPEQMVLAKSVDARTDVWSLGVILFELVAGHPPFRAEAVTELAIKVATQPPPRLRTLAPHAPAGLEQVVAKCLEKDSGGPVPDHRRARGRARRFRNPRRRASRSNALSGRCATSLRRPRIPPPEPYRKLSRPRNVKPGRPGGTPERRGDPVDDGRRRSSWPAEPFCSFSSPRVGSC